MKVIVAGSRSITALLVVEMAWKDSQFEITELISGGARGVDSLGEQLATQKGIPIKRFTPNWDLYGKKAGILRNMEMGRYADALIACHDGSSRGTAHMISFMQSLNKPVFIGLVPPPTKEV